MANVKLMNAEIFTALRDSGMAEEHATRIAAAIPVSTDLVTKADLKADLAELRSELLRWMIVSQGAFAGLIVALVKFL